MRKRQNNDLEHTELAEVNVTPLADVSLTLVIMMMVMAPMVLQSMIQVKPAQAMATKAEKRVVEKPIFIDITNKGFSINKNKIKNEYEFFRVLQKNLSAKRDRSVIITSAQDVPYSTVVRALDLVKQSGASNLSLVPRKGGTS